MHPLGHRLGRGGDGHPVPVAAAVGAPRDRVGDAGPEPRLQVAGELPRRHERAHQLGQRLEQVHVDDLAHPRVHRHHRGEGGGQAGDLVGEGDGREQRRPVGLAVDAGEARQRLGQRGEARPAGVGAVLAEAGDAGDDQPRVARRAGRRAPARAARACRVGSSRPARRRSRPARRIRAESAGSFRSRTTLRLLRPASFHQRVTSSVGVAPPHGPRGVAEHGPLDLDHVGTEVGEVAGAPRPGHDRGAVDHAQVGERPGRCRFGHRCDRIGRVAPGLSGG